MPKNRKPRRSIRRGRKMTALDRSWEPAFLAALALVPCVVDAADKAGVHRSTAYERMKSHPDFALACDDAMTAGVDRLEAHLFRRAVEGDLRPVTVAGMKEFVREYPDQVAMFLLRAHRPERYRESKELRHVAGGTLAEAMAAADEVHDPDEDVDARPS